MANHVARAANLGASVLIRESWYKSENYDDVGGNMGKVRAPNGIDGGKCSQIGEGKITLVISKQGCFVMTDFNLSSHAIDTFACALGLEPGTDGRAALGQPILVTLAESQSDWLSAVETLIHASQRLVIAVDERWLEDRYEDDHGYSQPMARAYEIVDGALIASPVMLHHSRSGIFRLCTADLTRAYLLSCDGNGFWEELDPEFTKNASVGFELAGSRWFWDHDELTTDDIIKVMREIEAEEMLGSQKPLPGVVLNMGTWRKPTNLVK